MPFYLLIVLIIIGTITNYFVMIGNLKKIRSNGSGFPYGEMIASAIFFGGHILLLSYIFSEIREEDKMHKKAILISGILITVVEVIIIGLLIYSRVIVF